MLDSICFMSTCSSFSLGFSVSCLYLNMFLSCAEVGVFVAGSVFSRSALNTLSYTLVPDNARSSLPLKRFPASTTAHSGARADTIPREINAAISFSWSKLTYRLFG